MGDRKEHVSETFARLLWLYRKPDDSEWGGQDLENATGGAVGRSYVANLKNGRIGNPVVRVSPRLQVGRRTTVGGRGSPGIVTLVPF